MIDLDVLEKSTAVDTPFPVLLPRSMVMELIAELKAARAVLDEVRTTHGIAQWENDCTLCVLIDNYDAVVAEKK